MAVLDDQGAVLSEQRYLPFGAVRDDVGTITQTDFGYTFQRALPDTGLMDYKARFYSQRLGKFIQPDTLVPGPANPQSWNRYSYVGNSPISFSDPTGHMRLQEGDQNDRFKKSVFDDYEPREDDDDSNDRRKNDDPPENYIPFLKIIDELANIATLEEALLYGRPVYKHIKYAAPLSFLEYGIDAALQLHDDWNKDLNFYQRGMRVAIRGLESWGTDAAGNSIGIVCGAALQVNVPIPVVPAGAGYFAGAYTSSAIIDNIIVNNFNPMLFEYLGGP